MNDVHVCTSACRHITEVPSEAEGSIRSPAAADAAYKSSGECAGLHPLGLPKEQNVLLTYEPSLQSHQFFFLNLFDSCKTMIKSLPH